MQLTKSFYSPVEVAELAGLSSSTILNYIHARKLYAVKLSERTYRIPARSVALLLEPESVAPARVTRDPNAAVDLAEADTEPEAEPKAEPEPVEA